VDNAVIMLRLFVAADRRSKSHRGICRQVTALSNKKFAIVNYDTWCHIAAINRRVVASSTLGGQRINKNKNNREANE
jgi:hypothetical protein